MSRDNSEWLTLTEACNVLGIHPITLRSWVDQGLIQALRTPGGHRRIRRTQLQNFIAQQETAPTARTLLPPADQAVREIRRELDTRPVQQSSWYTQLTDSQRTEQRLLGQRLIGLLLQFVSRTDNAHEFLQEATHLAQEYGIRLKRAGLAASDVARGFLFFRRTIIQATYHPGSTYAQADAEGVRLLERINNFMDELLIATLDAYDAEPAPRTRARKPARPHHTTRKSNPRRKT
jgi:excisionase family DNA binding protein